MERFLTSHKGAERIGGDWTGEDGFLTSHKGMERSGAERTGEDWSGKDGFLISHRGAERSVSGSNSKGPERIGWDGRG